MAAQRAAKRSHTLEQYEAAAKASPEEQRRIQDKIVSDYLGVAETIARRYTKGAQDWNDIQQVAYLGLVKAARRFDAECGDDFVSYAVPTISGEIKRHLRDHGWFIRPPRPVQELHGQVARVVPQLMQELGHMPSCTEIAQALGQPRDLVKEALESRESLRPASLDRPIADDETLTIADTVADTDDRFERAEVAVELASACRRLPFQQRRIVYLRFFQQCTQQEIAAELGVTQMQVSRLLTKILDQLRNQLRTRAAAA
ncbi:SigB/SigF/SigG family RNA polymerase sigma factor [Okibacterium endophyticum]